MRLPTTAKSFMRLECLRAQGPRFQLGPSALVRISRAFDEAPMHSPKRAKSSMTPQCARAERQVFNQALVCLCTWAVSLTRPQFDGAQGP